MVGLLGYAAASGRIANAISDIKFGFSAAAGTPQPLRATAYTEQGSAALRSLSSSSAADTSAGTGAQQVTVTGYDNTLTTPITEIVTLNGVTAVATVNSFRFIEKMEVTRVGTGRVNAGIITLFVNNAGGGGTIGTIGVGNRVTAVGDNQTFWAHHYVRSGRIMYVQGMSFSNQGANDVLIFGRSINPTVATSAEIQKTPSFGGRRPMAASIAFSSPVAIPGPARFTLYANITGGGEVDGSFDFVEF
jgi:hypothetical protein